MFRICSLFFGSVSRRSEVAVYCVSSLRRAGDVSDKWCIVCKNDTVTYSDKKLPQKLKRGERCWIVPLNGITIDAEYQTGELCHAVRFCVEFNRLDLHGSGFTDFVAGKKEITVDEIKTLVLKNWHALCESERTKTNLNLVLATNCLICTDLVVHVERDLTQVDEAVIEWAPYILLPHVSLDSEEGRFWQCWEDTKSISVTKNRFVHREELDNFLPARELVSEDIFNVTKIQFGRSASSHIQLKLDDEVLSNLFSGLHLVLELTDSGIVLVDNSTNGMHFDGRILRRGERFIVPKEERNFLLQFAYILEMRVEIQPFVPFISRWGKISGLPEDILLRLVNKENYDLASRLNIGSIKIQHTENLTPNSDAINYYTEQSASAAINELIKNKKQNPNCGKEFEIVLSGLKRKQNKWIFTNGKQSYYSVQIEK
jgi:hypothetical protein